MNAEARNWREILFSRKMLICVFLGFSSGMPLFVLVNLVPAWLRTEDVDLATIGLAGRLEGRRGGVLVRPLVAVVVEVCRDRALVVG